MKTDALKNKPVLFRDLGSIEEENGEITRISVSSERPCRDYIYNPEMDRCVYADVVLVHSQEAIDWDWIKDGIPLRDKHFGEVVARAMNPFIEDGKLASTDIIWGAGFTAERVHKDAEAGVSPAMSIEADYDLKDCVFTVREDGTCDVRVNKWRPLAAAFVPIPADPSVGVNRAYISGDTVATAPRAAGTGPDIERSKKMEDNKDVVEILDVCGKHGVSVDTARGYIEKGMSVEAVRDAILDGYAAKKEAVPEVKTGIVDQMQKATGRAYSIGRAIRAQLPNCKEDVGFELECSQEIARQFGRQPEGLFVARDVTTTTAAGIVTTTQRPQDYVDFLRNKLVFSALGARILSGLMGKITIPRAKTDATAAAVAETKKTPKSSPTWDQITLTPHAISSHVALTKDTAFNTAPAAEGLILDMMMSAVAEKVQQQALFGTGSEDEIKGLVSSLSDLGAISDWKGLTNMQGKVAGANVEVARCQWLTNPTTFSDLRAIPRNAAGGDAFAAELVGNTARIADAVAQLTSTVPVKAAIYGDWNNLIIALFGALDVVVDPYTLSDDRMIRVTVTQFADAANCGGGRFAYATKMGDPAAA